MLIYLAMIDSPEGKNKFEIIYEQYKNLMFYTANKILGDTRDSEDIVHSLSVDDYNFLLDCQGNQVGYMTFIGLNRIKYVLYDDSYIVNVNDNENIDYIKIEYQDDGYYEFSASYEQLPSNTVSISLPEYANMNPTVQTVGESSLSASAVSTIITPTNIMDAAQLAERNDY